MGSQIYPLKGVAIRVYWRKHEIPDLDPSDPKLVLAVDGVPLEVTLTRTAVRRVQAHSGHVILHAILRLEGGIPRLTQADFQLLRTPDRQPEPVQTGPDSVPIRKTQVESSRASSLPLTPVWPSEGGGREV
jgi:hypothetical protein